MEASVNYFFNILNSEIEHFSEVLKVLIKKERALINNDHDNFIKVFKEEYSLCLKSRELELSRTSVLEVLSRKKGFNPESVKLKDLGGYLGEENNGKLTLIRKKLNNVLEAVKRQNQKCQLLLEKSLEIIRYSMKLMVGRKKIRKEFYNSNSRLEDSLRNTNLIDQKG